MVAMVMPLTHTWEVPERSIGICWLGQSSYLLKSHSGTVIALDPYLSNACKALGEAAGINMDRRFPPPFSPADLVGIDGCLLTHGHEDHLDPETVLPYRSAGGRGPFFAPAETIEKLGRLGVPAEELRMMWPNKVVEIGDFVVRGTFAIPLGADDLTHMGYLITVKNGPTAYFTGDTRYHENLADFVRPHAPEVLVTVINPFGNMDPGQAARLARDLGVKVAIPGHYDLFPDNTISPKYLQLNLMFLGRGDIYRELERGTMFVYPAAV